jgi:hypothetical protein
MNGGRRSFFSILAIFFDVEGELHLRVSFLGDVSFNPPVT